MVGCRSAVKLGVPALRFVRGGPAKVGACNSSISGKNGHGGHGGVLHQHDLDTPIFNNQKQKFKEK